MTDGAPGGVALGLHKGMTACAFPAFELLLVTAYAALRRILALGPLGDVGGMHGALKGDEVALGLAFHGMTGGTGHRVAGMVTGLAVFDLFLVNQMIEDRGFHGGAHWDWAFRRPGR